MDQIFQTFTIIRATIMREATIICFCCALVPTFALLKGDPQAKWRDFLRKDSHEDLSSQQEPLRTLKSVKGISVDFVALRADERLSSDAVFVHGEEFLRSISLGLKKFDVYENNTQTAHLHNLNGYEEMASTYLYDSHTAYSLHDLSIYRNFDDENQLLSFGSIREYEDNHIVQCGYDKHTADGTILVGSSHGSWAKDQAVEQDVARTLSNLLLHPVHLATRIEKGLTLLRRVIRIEQHQGINDEVCSKLHTESIHPLELFSTMRMTSIGESPFQHSYSTKEPTESRDSAEKVPSDLTVMSSDSSESTRFLSTLVEPDAPLKTCEGGTQFGWTEGCLEYNAEVPGSFNFNYDVNTGKAIKPSIPLDTGISCENCYAFLGAGILVIVQYGYNDHYLDFEVKAGGGYGLSAQVAMKDPIINSMDDTPLVQASTAWSSYSLGRVLILKHKFGGLTASLSGSGRATGFVQFGGLEKAYCQMGMVYELPTLLNGGQFRRIYECNAESIPPYIVSSSLETTSLSVELAVTGVENFEMTYSYISISFDASIRGTVGYSTGSVGDASVTVFPDTGRRLLPADNWKVEHDSSTNAPHYNFLPGDVTIILFEYSGFNPSEDIILFYSVQRLDAEYPIMQRNFTTSGSGSGVFEGSWTVPWDYILAGVGMNDTVISVRATNSISKTFNSEILGFSAFTDSDGIFSAPSASEIILIDTPYTLRWTPDLLHYFKPNTMGGFLGEDVVAAQVVFEVVAEKISFNGSVISSTVYQNLTQGPVSNTGVRVVTFHSVLYDMGDRFYINVKSTNNSDTYGWSKSYFTLKKEKGLPPHILSTLPVMLSMKKSLSLSPPRGSFAAPSVSGTRSKASRSLATGCYPGLGELSFRLDGIIGLKKLTLTISEWFGLMYSFDTSSTRPYTFEIVGLHKSCVTSLTARPSSSPVADTSHPSSAPIMLTPSSAPIYRPTRDPAFIPVPVIATLNHRYSFNTEAITDSIGGANGTIGSNVEISSGWAIFGELWESDLESRSAVQLPARILEPTAESGATAFSIEVWYTTSPDQMHSGYCPMLFQFGTAGTSDGSVGIGRGPCSSDVGYISLLSPGETDCVTYSKMLFNGTYHLHLVLTYALGGSVRLYLDGKLATMCSGTISGSAYDMAVSTETNYLGRSFLSGDVGLAGAIDEFRVWNGELSADAVVANYKAGADYIGVVTARPTSLPTAVRTAAPSAAPTAKLTAASSAAPTAEPTVVPTATPSAKPTQIESSSLSARHTLHGLNSTVARSPTSIKRIKHSLESVLHLSSRRVWNVTLTPLSSVNTLHRPLSASTVSTHDSTLSRNSTLPIPTGTYSLRYFILFDASPVSEADLMKAITTAALSGNLTSAIRDSDPSFSGMYLSGSPSFTVLSSAPSSTSPTQSDKSAFYIWIPIYVWIVIGVAVALLLLCCALFVFIRYRRFNVTPTDSL